MHAYHYPDLFFGLAKARRATLQAIEVELMVNQAIRLAMDMPDR
ncbi:conserved hypothetical protein [Vibrio crassostreae]|nr:conserved hypothetical protein [Vibrio crassostreae]CAK1791278.1 conserved hypothetical protein [Vibrio crassostreae]CAK1798627.1 conserved hypothetical protein [Vibrio crassostreae]CAK1806183.1 conserved hypothetical protein [Vibrio crassostreae]CAK1806785.1 conserved hypothetical protein [Vibrio crassostreae]